MSVCRLCGGETTHRFTCLVLGRYDVDYWVCQACGSLQTDPPFWLSISYGIPGVHIDTGQAARNVQTWLQLSFLLEQIGFDRDLPCLDYGGSAGLLTRLMRDSGFDFRAYDPFESSKYANYFCVDHLADTRPYLLTAFEVVEHLPDPRASLTEILVTGARIVVFSTELYRGEGAEWWYIAALSGQHVFFYSEKALIEFAAEHGYDFREIGAFKLFVRRGSRYDERLHADRLRSPTADEIGHKLIALEWGTEATRRDNVWACERFERELPAQIACLSEAGKDGPQTGSQRAIVAEPVGGQTPDWATWNLLAPAEPSASLSSLVAAGQVRADAGDRVFEAWRNLRNDVRNLVGELVDVALSHPIDAEDGRLLKRAVDFLSASAPAREGRALAALADEASAALRRSLRRAEAGKREFEALGKRSEAAEGSARDRVKEVEALQRERDALQSRLGSAEQGVSDLGVRLEAAEGSARDRAEEVEAFQRERDALQSRLCSAEQGVSDLGVRLEAAEGSARDRAQEVEALQCERDALQSRLGSAERSAADLEVRLEAETREAGIAQERALTAEAALERTETALGERQAERDQLARRLSEIIEDHSAAEQRLSERIVALNERLTGKVDQDDRPSSPNGAAEPDAVEHLERAAAALLDRLQQMEARAAASAEIADDLRQRLERQSREVCRLRAVAS